MATQKGRKVARIKKVHGDHLGLGSTIEFERDPGSGTFDNFQRRVNGKTYKYRRARVWLDDAKGVRIRKTLYGKTDVELRSKIKKLIAKPASTINPEKTSVEDWVDLWLKTSQKQKPKTLRDYRQNFEKHIKSGIGKAKIGKVTPQNLRAFFKELEDDGIGPSTVEVSYKVLHAAFAQLVRDGTLDRNPVSTVGKPRVPKPDKRIPTVDEAKKILKAAEGNRYYPLILLALLSSMRQGELFALRWREDVRLDQGFLRVNHTLTTDADGKLVLDDPKTEAARRRVELDPKLVAELTKLRKANPKATYLFTAPDGGLIVKGNFRKRVWLPLLKKAKVPGLKFHTLRHFGNSLLAQQGHNPKVLQARLGHATVAMTMNTYTHLMPNASREAANTLSDLFLGGLNGAKNGAKSKVRKSRKSNKAL